MNATDDAATAAAFITRTGTVFPSVVDNSAAGREVRFAKYRIDGLPTSYVIDRDGRVADAWQGNDFDRATRALAGLGIR